MAEFLVTISADTEWQVIQGLLPQNQKGITPFGQFIDQHIDQSQVIWMQGGWGKISAAASMQYGIDRWQPQLVINLGTCGGFEGKIQRGEILLADELLVYDIYERMGDAQEALAAYTTAPDLAWLGPDLPAGVRRGRLISADRDIDPLEVDTLLGQYNAAASDWESGAIAWTVARNRLPCLVLRGVTDLVNNQGGEAYDNWTFFEQHTREIMKDLFEILPFFLQRWHQG